MKTFKLVLILLITFSTAPCFGQNIKISDGTSTKTIKSGYILDLTLGEPDEEDDLCCTYLGLEATFIEATRDSIKLILNRLYTNKSFERGEGIIGLDLLDMDNPVMIAKSDIYSLTKYKSEKAMKFQETMAVIGGILIFSGVISAANGLIFNENGSTKNIMIAGGIQFGAGLILGLSTTSKTHIMKSECDPWRFE